MTITDPGHVPTQTPNVSPITADWANAVRDRLAHRFATTAARDAALTSPTEGMIAYVTADDSLYIYVNAAWWPMWSPNTPIGSLQSGTTDSGGLLTLTPANLGLTTIAGGVASILWAVTGTNDAAFAQCRVNSGNLQVICWRWASTLGSAPLVRIASTSVTLYVLAWGNR